MDEFELNETWLSRKYSNGEINTAYSWVTVIDPEFFAQGDDADQIIKEVHSIWINGDCTEEEAFNKWVNAYL